MSQAISFLLPPNGNRPKYDTSSIFNGRGRLSSIDQLRSAFAASNAVHFPTKQGGCA